MTTGLLLVCTGPWKSERSGTSLVNATNSSQLIGSLRSTSVVFLQRHLVQLHC